MSNPYFDQDEIETHTSEEEIYKPPEKARSIPLTLYPDQEKEVDKLSKKLAKLTRTRYNKSVTIRAVIKFALEHFDEHEEEFIKYYHRSRSR